MHEPGVITTDTDWREVLANPGERDHTVQLYDALGFLTNAVSHYTTTGLSRGEAVLLVVTPEHWTAFEQRLVQGGLDVAQLRQRGQLTVLDAAGVLSRFMVHGSPQ